MNTLFDRLTIWHLGHLGLTEDRTFIVTLIADRLEYGARSCVESIYYFPT